MAPSPTSRMEMRPHAHDALVARQARGRGVGRQPGEHSLERAAALVGTLPGAFRHAALGAVDAHVMFRRLGS